MKFEPKTPPREFEVGYDVKGIIRDCGSMRLAPDEQVTFLTEAGGEYDLTRKEWGLCHAVAERPAGGLQSSCGPGQEPRGPVFVLLVERGQEEAFDHYVRSEPLKIITWLDTQDALQAPEAALERRP